MINSKRKKKALEIIVKNITNFRDLNLYNSEFINEGLIYRSSTLTNHQEGEMKESLLTCGVSGIVDLRSDIEIRRDSYEDDFLIGFKFYWTPLDISFPPHVVANAGLEHLDLYHQFIWYVLFYNNHEIQKIFNILSHKDNYPLILHCHAGRDRTGVISVLILLLVDAPVESIIKDYTATDDKTRSEDIEFLISLVNEVGGVELYLESVGVTKETQQKVKNILK